MTKNQESPSNEGIQASVVNADVLAVGRNAQAVKTVLGNADRTKLMEAVAKIDQELELLFVNRPDLRDLRDNAKELARTVNHEVVDPQQVEGTLGRLISKLKEGGVIVKEVAGLIAPIQAIGGLLHLSLAGLGFL
jgi:predicted metal-dependent RNase